MPIITLIWTAFVEFTAAQVECPPEAQEVLTEVHYDFLQEAIGYSN